VPAIDPRENGHKSDLDEVSIRERRAVTRTSASKGAQIWQVGAEAPTSGGLHRATAARAFVRSGAAIVDAQKCVAPTSARPR